MTFKTRLRPVRVLLIAIMLCFECNSPSIAAKIPELLGIIAADTQWTYFGGVSIVPAGDQNGDGFADFWTYDFRHSAFLFLGSSSPLSSQPAMRLNNVNPPGSNIGDINFDGQDDYAWTTWNPLDSNKMQIFFGGVNLDTVPDAYFGRTTGIYNDLRIPYNRAILVDLTGDGSSELTTWANDQSHVLIYFTGVLEDTVEDIVLRAYDSPYPFESFGWGRASIDLNGDSYADLVVSHNPAGQYQYEGQLWCYFGGPSFDTIPDIRFTQPGSWAPGHDGFGRVMFNAGDMNGDSFDDLYVAHGNSEDSLSFIYFGGAAFDTIPEVAIPVFAYNGAPAGDVNNDGFQDVMVGRAINSSTTARVHVYFGGPTVDSIPDISIFASDLPEFNLEFGRAVAGVGDVNGDGIDDFAAGAYNDFGIGRVYVFAGYQGSVDVPDEPTSLPRDFELHQNYPNPFNASTTISFSLTRRSSVTIQIVNNGGQVIRTLCSSDFSPGHHFIQWDGKDDDGSALASGIYFCKMSGVARSASVKMVLLK